MHRLAHLVLSAAMEDADSSYDDILEELDHSRNAMVSQAIIGRRLTSADLSDPVNVIQSALDRFHGV